MPILLCAATATRMYPACAMELYASSRLMLGCSSAAKFPRIIVSSAHDHTNGSQRFVIGSNAVIYTRTNMANATAFGPADMNAVTGAGAPWYTSGAQIWKGTTEA